MFSTPSGLTAQIHLQSPGSKTHTGVLSSSSPHERSSPDGYTQQWKGTERAAETDAPGAAHCAAVLPSVLGPVFSLTSMHVKDHK